MENAFPTAGHAGLSASDGWVAVEPKKAFPNHYQQSSFGFSHTLSDHTLFELPSLIELAERYETHSKGAYWSSVKVKPGDTWETGVERRATLIETIRAVAQADALVILKDVQDDPVLGPTIKGLSQSIVECVGSALRDDLILARGSILVASPHRVTTYHLDGATNFLLQLSGAKRIWVFDQTDRTLVTPEELEAYHSGDLSGAVFNLARQAEGKLYPLDRNRGVHIPSHAPHWAQNGGDVSIALSLNYDLHSIGRCGQIYRVNRRLRRLGLEPTLPGMSKWRDTVKLGVAGIVHAVRKLARTGVTAGSLLGRSLAEL